MAQGRLIGASVVALGTAAELVAPAPTAAATVADWGIGAAFAGGGAWLLSRAPAAGRLALLTSAAWYLGTLAAGRGDVLAVFALAYRGPLLHLLLVPRARVLAAAAWIAALLPPALAGPATAASAAAVAAVLVARARLAPAGRHEALLASAVAAAGLSATWSVAALGVVHGTALEILNAVAVLAAGAAALVAATGAWSRRAAGALVIELGADRRPDRPIAAQLARALADPELELRYAIPGVGWVDERGQPASVPDGQAVTRAAVPGGGEVALLHGAVGSGDARLSAAAAAAAALALDSARLEAAVLARAADVRASRRRLLSAADAERRALEQRLSAGPLAGLGRVEQQLEDGELRAELRAAIRELTDLGRGLYPLAGVDLARALDEMARRSPVPATVQLAGDTHALTDGLRATAWFVCSEALANVARHSRATHASVAIDVDATELRVEVRDDGRGGAIAARGLRGLADRVEASGGTLLVTSPAGGPTIILARLPLA